MTGESLIFKSMDLNRELSVKDYLKELLMAVWREDEGFSGKRPFGNSGWKYEIYECLIEYCVVPGTLDEDGYVIEIDTEKADEIIYGIIKEF
jgi:hypothetical protein